MLGAIIGDIVGSPYERINIKHENFELFSEKSRLTDDSILSLAVSDAFLNSKDYAKTLKEYARMFPLAGYGGAFINWVDSPSLEPYGSYGNGSAMRVSSIAWLLDTLDHVLHEAKISAECTHNHPEGIKGAQAIAACIFLARHGSSKNEIKDYVINEFDYDLNLSFDEIRQREFNATCQATVPVAIFSFLNTDDFESCLKKSVSLGGDCDTIASMACAIAEAYYKSIPIRIANNAMAKIEESDFLHSVFQQFMKDCKNYMIKDYIK